LITGPSPGGIGAEAARVIAKYANLVVLAGRNLGKINQTIENIKQETPAANLRPLLLDLGSLETVRNAAAEVNAYPENIHVLINNAAIMAVPYGTTKDGFESQLGSNFLGHFLFTALIFPRLVAASSPTFPSRVVGVSSSAHRRSDFRFDDYNFSGGKTYHNWVAYGQSKTAIIMMINELARRAKEQSVNVLAYSLDPGAILSGLQQHTPNSDYQGLGAMDENGEWLIEWNTMERGTSVYIYAAFDPSLKEQSGAYLKDVRVADDHRQPYTRDEENSKKLWELAETLTNQKFVV